jgi:cysteinyl-tRNA synthetase
MQLWNASRENIFRLFIRTDSCFALQMNSPLRRVARAVLFVLTLLADVAFAEVMPPASFAYVLQADSLAKSQADAVQKLAACERDWLVLDANFSSPDEPWATNNISVIRAGKFGRKVIAYLSIGEAEDYRAYWRSAWRTNPPAFLLAQNPEWKGNYRVKYWRAEWQKIILADVDKIMATGFDGVYLDIVDGFETFEQDGNNFIDDRVNPETKQSYRRDMVDWVKAVAARARAKNPTALVIPQNGTQLFAHADFLAVADASGVEDLFTNSDKLQTSAETKYRLETLAPLLAAHKPALDIEYAKRKERQTFARESAAQHGLICLVTDRQLKTLGVSGK